MDSEVGFFFYHKWADLQWPKMKCIPKNKKEGIFFFGKKKEGILTMEH